MIILISFELTMWDLHAKFDLKTMILLSRCNARALLLVGITLLTLYLCPLKEPIEELSVTLDIFNGMKIEATFAKWSTQGERNVKQDN